MELDFAILFRNLFFETADELFFDVYQLGELLVLGGAELLLDELADGHVLGNHRGLVYHGVNELEAVVVFYKFDFGTTENGFLRSSEAHDFVLQRNALYVLFLLRLLVVDKPRHHIYEHVVNLVDQDHFIHPR